MMYKKNRLVTFILAISILCFIGGGIPARVLAQEPPAFAPGEILVKFQAGVGVQGAQSSLRAEGLQPLELVGRSQVIRVRVEPGRELEAIAELRARGDVVIAEPNYIIHALDTWPNDTYYQSQQWGPEKIGAPAAWGLSTGGSNVTIAVIDTGIDLDHPDLNCPGKLLPGWDYVNNDSVPDDDNGHGTHVAGIAGACSNNGLGVAGIAWNARLLPLKVLDSTGNGYFSNVAQAVEAAADQGARVINLSMGATVSSDVLASAISYATNRGALVVAAAGNAAQSGNPVIYPGADPNAFAVAATGSADNWASFSSYHPYVDVAAPGDGIYSTYWWGSSTYLSKSGTSMATPHVAGLAALIWSLRPELTPAQVRSVIQSTVDDLGAPGIDDYFGYGRINAGRALASVSGVQFTGYSGLIVAPSPLLFLVDDDSGPFPAASPLVISSVNRNVTTWTVSESPDEPWLDLSATTVASQITSAGSSGQITLAVSRPPVGSYGWHSTTLVVTGTTSAGVIVGPVSLPVQISYVPNLLEYRFPIMAK